MTVKIEVYLGVVWVWRISGGWYTCIRAFPMALKKNGDPDIEHDSVKKYVKEKTRE